jgi:hypothetical protein
MVGSLLLSLNVANSVAQDLRLEISVPKTKINLREPVNLTVKLTNSSSRPYYVSGAVDLGDIGIGHEFGSYQLQLRKNGTTEFVSGRPGMATDGIPPRNLSTADFSCAPSTRTAARGYVYWADLHFRLAWPNAAGSIAL